MIYSEGNVDNFRSSLSHREIKTLESEEYITKLKIIDLSMVFYPYQIKEWVSLSHGEIDQLINHHSLSVGI